MDENLERLLRKLLLEKESGSFSGGNSLGGGSTQIPDQKKLTQSIRDARANLESLNKNGFIKTARATEEVNRKLQKFERDLYAVDHRLEELDEQLDETRATYKQLTDVERELLLSERKKLLALKSELDAQKARDKRWENASQLVRGFGNLAAGAGQILLNSIRSIAAAVQSGGQGFMLANAMFDAQVDAQAFATDVVAKGAESAGTALMFMKGKARIVGFALETFGVLLGHYNQFQSQAQKLGAQILFSGAEKLANSYFTAAAGGALFARGADDAFNALKGSRFLYENLGEMVKEFGATMGRANQSVPQAIRQIGRVGAAFKQSGISEELRNLGIEYKDQAGYIAETMADLNRSRPGRIATDKEVAVRTREYARNLATLQAITGEDVRAKARESSERANNLRFQQQLNKMDATSRGKIMDAFTRMSKQEQRDFMDAYNNGGRMVNEAGAQLAALSPAYGQFMKSLTDAAAAGRLNADMYDQAAGQYGPAVRQQMMAAEGFGRAAGQVGSPLFELGQDFLAVSQHLDQFNKESVDKTKQNLKELGENAQRVDVAPINAAFIKTGLILNDFQIALQEEIIKKLPAFAEQMQGFLNSLMAALNGFTAGLNSDIINKMGIFEKAWDYIYTGVTAGMIFFKDGIKNIMGSIGAWVDNLIGGAKNLWQGAKNLVGMGEPKPGTVSATPAGPKSHMVGGKEVPIAESIKKFESFGEVGLKRAGYSAEQIAAVRAAKEAAEHVAAEAAGVAAEKAIAVTGEEVAIKAGGRFAAAFAKNAIPGINTALNTVDAGIRASAGDYIGAGISATSAAVGWIPLFGQGASLLLDVANVSRDLYKANEETRKLVDGATSSVKNAVSSSPAKAEPANPKSSDNAGKGKAKSEPAQTNQGLGAPVVKPTPTNPDSMFDANGRYIPPDQRSSAPQIGKATEQKVSSAKAVADQQAQADRADSVSLIANAEETNRLLRQQNSYLEKIARARA